MPPQRPLKLLLRAWLILSGTCLALAAAAHFYIGLNNDHANLVDNVQRWLSGGKPYEAYADVNPPLIHLLYLPPVWLADAMHWPQHLCLYAWVYAWIGLSLFLSYKLLEPGNRSLRYITLSAVACGLLITCFIHQVFADREHWMLCFITPWLILQSPLVQRSLIPARTRYATAAFAALGFALKPYFILFYLATTAFRLLHTSLLSQLKEHEHHILWFMGVLYAALIYFCFPQYLQETATLVWYTYPDSSWSFASRWHVMLTVLLQGFWSTWLWTAIGFYVLRGIARQTLLYLLTLQLVTLALYLLNAGWWYTQYPFLAVNLWLCMAAGAGLMLLVGTFRSAGLAWLVPAIAATLYFYHAAPAIDRASNDMRAQRLSGHPTAFYLMNEKARTALLGQMKDAKTYIFFSTNLRALSLQTDDGPRPVGRYDHLWPLPALARLQHDKSETSLYSWLRDVFVSGIAEDLKTHNPDVIIVDVSPYHPPLPQDFKVMPYLMSHPAFSFAMHMYSLEKNINTCRDGQITACAFDVYSRSGSNKKQ